MKKSHNNIDTGNILNAFLVKHKIPKSFLGDKIGRNGLGVLAFVRNSSIQTGILIEICHALKHNFFRDIADRLPEDFTKTELKDGRLITEKDQIIALLEEENKVLSIQNDLMKKAL